KSALAVVQDPVAPAGRGGGGLLRRRAGGGKGGGVAPPGRTARDRRFQEITPAEAVIRHVFLPASDSTSWCQRSFLAWTKMRHFRLRRQGCSVQGLLRPISKVAMVCQRLRGCIVAILADWSSQRVTSVVHNRGRSRARAVIRIRGVVPTSVAPLLAGRCFFATSWKP